MRLIRGLWLKLTCLHMNWTKFPLVGEIIPPDDWRLNTGWWMCVLCRKRKNFGYNGRPVQYDRDE